VSAEQCYNRERAPNSPPKVPLTVHRSPNPTTCLIPGPVRPVMPNGIRIQSTVFPQCTGQTDRCTDRPTDRPRESLIAAFRERRGLIIIIQLQSHLQLQTVTGLDLWPD